MSHSLENKRRVSVLLPYKIKDGEIFVFLQKRGNDAKILPGYFAFFGGRIEEGESSEETLVREIQEELCFLVKDHKFLGTYDLGKAIGSIYILKVSNNFENKIKVMEGEYGKFFSEDEARKEPMIMDHDKKALEDLYKVIIENKD